jgi:hypothetical protein
MASACARSSSSPRRTDFDNLTRGRREYRRDWVAAGHHVEMHEATVIGLIRRAHSAHALEVEDALETYRQMREQHLANRIVVAWWFWRPGIQRIGRVVAARAAD